MKKITRSDEEYAFGICVLLFLLLAGWFFIDAFIPDITEINEGGASLTKEDSARFYVSGGPLQVKSLDGQSVKWKRKFATKLIAVLLPPGGHTFTMDFRESKGGFDYSAKDLKISADFAPGKYYQFDYSLDEKTSNISYSIKEAEPVAFKTGFNPDRGFLVIVVIAFAGLILFYRTQVIPGNLNSKPSPHPEIVVNHTPGLPNIVIDIEEYLKAFDRKVFSLDAEETLTLDNLTPVFQFTAKDLGLKGIKTSDITEAQYREPIKRIASQKPNSAILYSFAWKGKKMIGYWLRGRYLYTLE
jgi:hypothetical protein